MNDSDILLKYAVEGIVNKINKDNMSPQEAVTKVARELDLNTNFIKRASEVINVALHYNHFNKNTSAKAADFPLVDAVKVAENIYGLQEKTPAELRSEHFSPVNAEDSIPNFNKYYNDPRFKAAFEQIVNCKETHTSFPISDKGLFEKSAHYIQRLYKQLDEAKTKVAGARFKANRMFCSVIEKFARDEAYRPSFAEFERQVYSLHGTGVQPYVDLMYKSADIKEERGKHDPKYQLFDNSKEAHLFGEFLTAGKALADAEENVKIAEHNYTFEKAYRDGAIRANVQKQTGEETGREKLARVKEEMGGILDPVLKAATEKGAAASKPQNSFNPLDAFIDKYRSATAPTSLAYSTSDKDNLDRKLLVENLISTDPILSTVHPKKVTDAYQQLLHYGPELSKEKETVRAVLRQMVSAQSLSPFDTQQLIDANTKYMQQKLLIEGKPS